MANHRNKLSGKKKAKVFHTITIAGREFKVNGTWYLSPRRKWGKHGQS